MELVDLPVVPAVPVVEQFPGLRPPEDVLRVLADEPRPVALTGDWYGGGAVVTCSPAHVPAPAADPLEVLRRLPVLTGPAEHPRAVCGGWFGWLGYRYGRRLDRVQVPDPEARLLPDWSLAWYDALLRWDELDGTWWFEALVTPQRRAALREHRARLVSALTAPVPRQPATLRHLLAPDRSAHVAAVERCTAAIRRGQLFQACICTRVEARLDGRAADLWAMAAERLRPARAAFVAGPWGAVASLSPELFLRRTGRSVGTAPIKGTAPRTGSPEDGRHAERLAASTKDAAENVMIVDLLRNDLGRVCVPGSVDVPDLLSLEPHPGVWHLVSRVRGQLRPECDDADLLRATLPPGSVTGAPKVRAGDLIAELESAPREAYCGVVGGVSPVGGLELNVAIRTVEVSGRRAWLGVGGGVTAESTPSEEWRECRDKAVAVLEACGADPSDWPAEPRPDPALALSGVFETMLVRDGRVENLPDHLTRLRRSCWELYGLRLPDAAEVAVFGAARGLEGTWRVRLDLAPGMGGGMTTRTAVSPHGGPRPVPSQPGVRVRTVVVGDGAGGHKLADRRTWTAAEVGLGADEAVIAVDAAGHILEGSRDSVFVVVDGTLCTAPLDGRILPGTTRAEVLDIAHDLALDVRLAAVTASQLEEASGLFLTNALHGVRWVTRHPYGGWPLPDPLVVEIGRMLLERRSPERTSGRRR